MADDSEFGEFSSVSEGWSDQNHVTPSFNPDWLVYSDNQDWTAGGVIPNNEHPWNASLPELPKELSNLLSDEMTSLGDINTLPATIADLPTNGSGHVFGNFEFSLDSEVVMATNNPITDINVAISTENSDITNKSQSMSVGGEVIVDEDDEFGDFEGPSIPKQPEMVQAANVVASELQDEAEDEFGGFVSTTTTTTEVKEKVTADDDFGSFEAAEFVAASSFPPLQAAQPTASTVVAPTSNFGAPPTNKPPPTFSTVAESCFHCEEQQAGPVSTTDQESLNSLAEQSSLWSSLQSGLKTTSPLYAWNKSHVEDQYFAALRVDPMLVYTILSFAEEMGMAPLAPQDQLLADEGFQWPDSPTEERPKEVAATLLDLTLSSPVPTASSMALSRHDSFTLDADLMGLDFTLTDDPQLTAMVGEGLPDPVMIEASNSKTADAIADILGLTTNPYLTNKDDNQLISQDNPLIGQDDNNDNKEGDHEDKLTSQDNQSTSANIDNTLFTVEAEHVEAVTTSDTSPAATNSLSQPLESLIVSKDQLQSLMPSQETLDALKVSPDVLQSLAESDSKPVTDDNNQPANLSNAALDLLSSLPVLPPESTHTPGLSMVAQDLLTSLPDVTFMLSNTHTKHT